MMERGSGFAEAGNISDLVPVACLRVSRFLAELLAKSRTEYRRGGGEIELDASRGNLFRSINRTRGTRSLFFTPRDRFLVSVAPFINFVAGKRF